MTPSSPISRLRILGYRFHYGKLRINPVLKPWAGVDDRVDRLRGLLHLIGRLL